ncbi:hypothetical protein AUK22_02655 [bacterium CG2_30_54_10]|nr:MAG: hypothetical protein AUK22_02655 [bacterium CG2_30_54_10]
MVAGFQEGRLLRQFVSEAAVAAAQDGSPRKGAGLGERREAVVLFSGLAGFKPALAVRSPEALVEELNAFLEGMSQVIRKSGGEIDKFIGDKILAAFFPGRGESVAQPAARAIAAANLMRKWMRDNGREIPDPLGIGIATGIILIGVLGAESVRLEYAIIGNSVNLASRLNDLACTDKDGGVPIDDATLEAAGSAFGAEGETTSSLGEVAVKGKKRLVKVFRIRSKKGASADSQHKARFLTFVRNDKRCCHFDRREKSLPPGIIEFPRIIE